MTRLGEAMADGLDSAIASTGPPWGVTRAGARVELYFIRHSPRNGAEALAHFDWELVEYTHLYVLNRGILITPFHNMMLIAPSTTEYDVSRLVRGWHECLAELAAIES